MEKLFVILFCAVAWIGKGASTFYVATNGSDSADGSIGTPWLTIGHSAIGRVAGDTVIVNPGNYPERITIAPSVDGTISNRITFRSASKQMATNHGFYLNGSDYVTVDGFSISNTNNYSGGAGTTDGVYINSDFAEVVNNYIFNTPTRGVFVGKTLATGTYIASNTMYLVGSGIRMLSTSNTVIMGNDVSRLFNLLGASTVNAHADQDYLAGVSGYNVLVSSNFFHDTFFNEISYLILTNAGGSPIACTNDADARSKTGDSTAFCDWAGFARDYAHVDGTEFGAITNAVFEWNHIRGANTLCKAEHDPGWPYTTVIVRNNLAEGGGILTQSMLMWIYNNTIVSFAGYGIDFETPNSGGYIVFKNNIVDGGLLPIGVIGGSCSTNFFEANNVLLNYFKPFYNILCPTNAVTASMLSTNPMFATNPVSMIFADNSFPSYITNRTTNTITMGWSGSPPSISIGNIIEYSHDGVPRSVTATNISGNSFSVTFTPSISITNTYDSPVFYVWGSSFSAFDTTIATNSPAVDSGAFIATVTSLSGSGTSFTVDDARYFNAGWGAGTEHPVAGDKIQLKGQTNSVTITAISGNTLTVNQSLNWVNGQGVSLAYNGLAPDIGAFESGQTTSNPLIIVTPGSLSFGSTAIPFPVSLTLSVTNVGGGTLNYTATVGGAPYSITGGASGALAANAGANVTVQFAPTATGSFSDSVVFTGGGGASIPVTGSVTNLITTIISGNVTISGTTVIK